MSSFLILNNFHLGIELFGAITFFIAGWLFFKAYLIKRDKYSLIRSVGFWALCVWQIFSAVGGSSSVVLRLSLTVYSVGLLCILLSYAFEKLPDKPSYAFLALPVFNIATNFNILPTIFLILLSFLLFKQYYKDINKLLKWLAFGFVLLSLASIISNFVDPWSLNIMWILEYALKFLGFVSITLWIWNLLSFRVRQEMLIIFVSNGLFIALLIVTTFSSFFLRSLENETLRGLAASEKILNMQIDSLESRALATSQIISNNLDFASAAKARDIEDLSTIGNRILSNTGIQFMSVASRDGSVYFKNNFPITQGENLLSQSVGQESLEGRSATSVDVVGPEGLSIRATSPIYFQGKVIGIVMVGYLLDKEFTDSFKDNSGFETSLFVDNKVYASTTFLPESTTSIPKDEFWGSMKLLDQDIIGKSFKIQNSEDNDVATVVLSTTPGALVHSAETTNQMTILIVVLIVLGLILPLYRLTIYLTS
ncbi:MAG: Methyl-accepting chemotaxis protein [Parcubacteria bacterium C7867-005]|nr:MAG: Methyl-accepting chemotaxis protein [Parcubacteria bacterium C7867-005]